jgi:hypothetical protein
MDRAGTRASFGGLVWLHLCRPVHRVLSRDESSLGNGVLLPHGRNILPRVVLCGKAADVALLAHDKVEATNLVDTPRNFLHQLATKDSLVCNIASSRYKSGE